MNLRTSVLNIATEILSEMQKSHIISLNELDDLVQTRIANASRVNFVPALNLLFLIGCIDYDNETDAVLYLATSGDEQ